MKSVQSFLLIILTTMLTIALSARPGIAQEKLVCESDYTVQAGDFLSKIAADTLGSASLYPAIIAATNTKAAADSSYHVIAPNDVIQAGWKLCIPSDADAPGLLGSAATLTADPKPLTVEALANATYSGIYDEPVTLTDGVYEGEPFDEGGVARPVVQYIDNSEVYGDLTGSGLDDAAVLLVENSGGSGVFSYVGAQLNQDGQALDGGTALLGDRTQVISMVIENGQVVVDIVTAGPDEALCCGTLKLRKTLALKNGKLAEVGSEELGTVALDDLMDTRWVLERLNFDQPALSDSIITAEFANGQVMGSAGCNTYSATLSSDGGQTMTVGPVIATQMACPEPVIAQELDYLTALQNATGWSYFPGQLAIYYQNEDGSQGTLFFDPAAGNKFTPAQLQNATYSGIYDEPVTLTDGLYEGEPYVEGDASRPIVEYMNSSEIYGDLDGDDVEDAVVFLVESSGGTGNFVYVAAQLNRNGRPVDAGAVWIEDRIQVKSAVIENGQIKLEITAEGPGDAACCKSHKTNKAYALQDGQLAEIPGQDEALVRISAADLDGTSWTLLELDVDQPALADAPVTLSFAGDQLSGSGGCNTYGGSFTLSDDNPFVMTIGQVVSTQMACPDPILNQELAYLAALQSVSQWGYQIGNLALYYGKEDRSLGRLLFAPPAAAESSQVEMLTGATWQWVSFTDPVQQFDVEQPEAYTLTFQPDGALQIQADCNQVGASYSASEEGALSIQPGPATLAACPPESRGDEFVQNLSFASGYFFQDGHLFIDMMADGGTLEFSSTTP